MGNVVWAITFARTCKAGGEESSDFVFVNMESWLSGLWLRGAPFPPSGYSDGLAFDLEDIQAAVPLKSASEPTRGVPNHGETAPNPPSTAVGV